MDRGDWWATYSPWGYRVGHDSATNILRLNSLELLHHVCYNASHGWFHQNKDRANIHNIKVNDKPASADLVAVQEFHNHPVPDSPYPSSTPRLQTCHGPGCGVGAGSTRAPKAESWLADPRGSLGWRLQAGTHV